METFFPMLAQIFSTPIASTSEVKNGKRKEKKRIFVDVCNVMNRRKKNNNVTYHAM